jgi:ABC-type iron transport system FetAB permease component
MLWVQHYVIKFVSDLRQVGGFLWVLRYVDNKTWLFIHSLKYNYKIPVDVVYSIIYKSKLPVV